MRAADMVEQEVTILVPRKEWEAHKQRVELLITTLGAVLNALAASPFGGMIGPDIRREIERVCNL